MNLCTAVDIRICLAVQISQFDLILEKVVTGGLWDKSKACISQMRFARFYPPKIPIQKEFCTTILNISLLIFKGCFY